MNYYIQGNKEKAEQIRAAFEAKGCVMHTGIQCDLSDMIYYSLNGKVGSIKLRNLDLFKTHPDYKELELPVKPKFKKWDWIACDADSFTLSIKSVKDGNYFFHQGTSLPIKDIDEHYHLWTIQDAKDGDVLVTDGFICIFKKLDKDGYYIFSPCIYTIKDGLEIISDENDTIGSCSFKPATKEDRKLLFRKIKEKGYQWDDEKKELKKIPPHYDIANFHAGMPVLVRADNVCRWSYSVFSHITGNKDWLFAVCNGVSFTQCIPFNDDTKHLLGTTDMPSEEYINW